MKTQLGHLIQLLSRRDRINFAVLVGLMVVMAALELIGIGIIPAFLSAVLYPEKIVEFPFIGPLLDRLSVHSPRRLLLLGSAVLLGVFALKNGFRVVNLHLQTRYAARWMARLRTRLFHAYMNAPYAFFLRRNSADLLRNANMECNQLGRAVLMSLMTAAARAILFTFIVGMLIVVQPTASLVMLAVLGLAGILVFVKLQSKTQDAGLTEQYERGHSNQLVQQGLEGIKEARILGCEDAFIKSFRQSARRAASAFHYQLVTRRMGGPLLETAGVFTMVLVVVFLIQVRGRTVEDAIPALVLFAVALGRLRGAVDGLVREFTRLRYALVSVEPVYADLQALEAAQRGHAAMAAHASRHPLHLTRAIALENLTFRHAESPEPTVVDINVTIQKGTAVGFVGPTGAGKTTVVDLILGLLEPTAGRITVDGEDIRQNLRGWQQNLGYIPQTIYLLDDTIRHNVALGIPDKDLDEKNLHSAIHAARLDDMIARLPDGLDTAVGERGIRLSGGQRQRIGIARAIYRDPDILVMDEATSNVDPNTERAIVEAITTLKGNRTLIMVAHRLSSVKNCDCLFFMNAGKIEQAGTYEELRASHPEFRRMTQ